MKFLYGALIFFLIYILSPSARGQSVADSTKKTKEIFIAIEQQPSFPGGEGAFAKYISKKLQYPDVARLIGIDGRLVMTFIVERDGKITNATPINCIGAGCEAEAAKVLQSSPFWRPGIQNGRPVRVQYSVPISFKVDKGQVKLKDLSASDYGFVFNIKGQLYTLDEAKPIIGDSFQSADVQLAEPFYNIDNNAKFLMPHKKEVYMLTMKI